MWFTWQLVSSKYSYHLFLKSAFLSSEIQTWDDFSGPVTPTTL